MQNDDGFVPLSAATCVYNGTTSLSISGVSAVEEQVRGLLFSGRAASFVEPDNELELQPLPILFFLHRVSGEKCVVRSRQRIEGEF